MPGLVDTTIRLLSQEPLAGRVPTASILRLAEILDVAGFAYLEVSGGGVFDSAVRRGTESPWEQIRALNSRTSTPLALALRGRFLVGSRPVAGDFIRRFVHSAAESGVEIFRLHDPLNDVSNLSEAGEAIRDAGREFDGGLVYGSGHADALLAQARRLPGLGAARVLLHDPTGSLQPHRAGELVHALREATGLPVGLYCQGATGTALAAALEAARAGADLLSCTVYPVALSLHRVSSEALTQSLTGLGLDSGVSLERLWEASELVDEHIGDAPVTPLAPSIAVRSAQHKFPAGLVASLDSTLRAHGAADRLDEVLTEVARVREEVGSPPVASPIGQIIGSQALLNVLSANRYMTIVDELQALVAGRFGTPPGSVAPIIRRAVELVGDQAGDPEPAVELQALREQATGLAASEEELLLLALFGDDAEPLLEAIRARAGRDETLAAVGVEQTRAERIRELVRIVQETGIDEIEVEVEDMRVSVRRRVEPAPDGLGLLPVIGSEGGSSPPPPAALRGDLLRIESPMVGTFYRAPQPGVPPFVEVGDAVATGQTLCILEAMKLMNEVKAESDGIVRAIHVENSQPVEFGQLLFELEPLNGRPLDGL